MAKEFNNIAKVMKDARIAAGLSQCELNLTVKSNNGQFISNIERGLCSLPAKSVAKIAETLDVPADKIIKAMVKDYNLNVYRASGVVQPCL